LVAISSPATAISGTSAMITRGIVASIPIVASHYTDMQMQLSFLILMLMQFPDCKATVDEELHSQ